MHDYDDVRFVCVHSFPGDVVSGIKSLPAHSYDAPSSAEDVYLDAEANLEYRTQSKDGKHVV